MKGAVYYSATNLPCRRDRHQVQPDSKRTQEGCHCCRRIYRGGVRVPPPSRVGCACFRTIRSRLSQQYVKERAGARTERCARVFRLAFVPLPPFFCESPGEERWITLRYNAERRRSGRDRRSQDPEHGRSAGAQSGARQNEVADGISVRSGHGNPVFIGANISGALGI